MKISIQLIVYIAISIASIAEAIPSPFSAPSNNSIDINFLQSIADTLGVSTNGMEESLSTWQSIANFDPEEFNVTNLRSQNVPINPISPDDWDYHVKDKELTDAAIRVRVVDPSVLKIDTVKQYSGYLDTSESKHFFFWFFESRNDPKNDPILLWLTGGPGCSSLTALLFELGPSRITASLNPEYNPYSWNSNASIIFLDQPVNSGFSYSSDPSGSVSTTTAAATDIYGFLQLFFKKFPEYSHLNFTITGESYGGHFVPAIGKEIISRPVSERNFNFVSIAIGNGLTDPKTQFQYYQPMGCGGGGEKEVIPYPICIAQELQLPICVAGIEACYALNNIWACVPSYLICASGQLNPFQIITNRNIYDIREKCAQPPLCYAQMGWVEKYFQKQEIQKAIGADVVAFQSCNTNLNIDFVFHGDWNHPFHYDVRDLLEEGISVLIYAGDKDFICNWLGNAAWTKALKWSGHDGFNKALDAPWIVDGQKAGTVRNYGKFTFARVYDAGHMVPFNQPVNTLSMINNWIAGNYGLNE